METPFVRLVGDLEENFYQLGVKDREAAKKVLEHISSMFSLPWPWANLPAKSLVNFSLARMFQKKSPFHRAMMAYREGLELSSSTLYGGLLLPEVMSCLSRWFPAVPTTLLGCSSFFTMDDDYDGPLHGRILDFPLGGTFDQHERVIYYELKGLPKMVGIGSAGLCSPGLTGMNEYGMTLALHQKFTNIFNPQGTPIFELGLQLLGQCQTKQEAIDFLKQAKAVTTWCFYMSFADGTVLRADLMGDRLVYHEDGLSKGKVLYFNNMLEDKEIDQNQYLPYGFDWHNQTRKKMAHKKILQLQQSKLINEGRLLQTMATPLDQRGSHFSESKMDCITPSSLGAYTLNAAAGRLTLVPGPAPKYYRGHHHTFTQLWSAPETHYSNQPCRPGPTFQGMRHYLLAQSELDLKNYERAYHHFQMAIDHLRDHPEEIWARFYFLVLQFHHEPDQQLYPALLKEMRSLLPLLPVALKDHCLLYIARLERLGEGPLSVREGDFANANFGRIFQAELKLPARPLKKFLDTFVNLRPDTLDILYGHLR